ncbi:MAG: HNH endonuclease [Candidatus Eisenbacteria bacterium]|nr:HNH endonuclease [Candidatus Eisenbacteria bacterium]MBU1949110.1 HNH endonuclease [Candidatus Eisenbacteria bacterium]
MMTVEGEDPSSKQVQDLHISIQRLIQATRRGDAELMRLFREMDRVRGHERFGCCTMNDYVALVLGVDDVAARERMRVSRALGELSRLEEVLRNGQLSYAKVRAVTRVATVENEQEWINKALELTARELEWEVARSRKGDRGTHRFFHMKPMDREMTRLIIELPAEEMEMIHQAIEKIRRVAGGSVPPSEALLYMAAEMLNTEFDETRTADHFQVVVHVGKGCGDVGEGSSKNVSAETKVLPPAGEVQTECGKGWVSPEKVDQLMCDASIIMARHLDDGTIEVSDQGRTIPAATRRAVLWRDGRQCRVPGCRNRLWLDLHHHDPWWAGGEHSQANLITLCRQHHTALHEGRIRIARQRNPDDPVKFYAGQWEITSTGFDPTLG